MYTSAVGYAGKLIEKKKNCCQIQSIIYDSSVASKVGSKAIYNFLRRRKRKKIEREILNKPFESIHNAFGFIVDEKISNRPQTSSIFLAPL